jgi:hypothetical protein
MLNSNTSNLRLFTAVLTHFAQKWYVDMVNAIGCTTGGYKKGLRGRLSKRMADSNLYLVKLERNQK